ncbi:MAG: TIGR03986 family CRISPR-associated RAMP protein, partial [Candidatus Cloacimonetes bacterium]|nr:TIGR03986 family CRISPR-associated RAMP protein [Candidatus Cloacimonadota bacterium]
MAIKQRINAKAPYNFVPLNEEVIYHEESNSTNSFNDYSGDLYDGYIELEMTAKSPIYVRGTLTEEDVKNNNNKDTKKENSQHFKPAGYKFKIPGSSIRGMVRTLYEIVTYSKMTFIDDKNLYYRSFADRSFEFREKYTNIMVNNTKSRQVFAGYLEKSGRSYRIVKAERYHKVEENDFTRKFVLKNSTQGAADEEEKNNSGIPTYVDVSFYDNVENTEQNAEKPDNLLKNVKLVSGTAKEGLNDGYLIWQPNKELGKRWHWVIGEKTEEKFIINSKLALSYEGDASRDAVDLLDQAEKRKDVPCFFIHDDKEVLAFGHTRFFRLVYDKSIGDLIPDEHKIDKLDMAEALFGRIKKGKNEHTLAGRLCFEDAIAINEIEEDEERSPKILSAPKPNSFQLYLKQNKAEIKPAEENVKGVKNYDSRDSQLAGHKLYWHKIIDDAKYKWYEDNKDELKDHDELYTKIKPLKEGSKFKARIRFENLKDYELGALLTVLDLPEECCHKIGMAKPLGLGSIQIIPKLTIIYRNDRYKSFKSLGAK